MPNDISHNQIQSNRVKILKDKLNKAISLHKLYQTTEYQSVLLPVLQEATQIQWLNPLEPDFPIKYQLAYSKAAAFKEIMDLLKNAEVTMNRLRLELGQPEKNYETGT